MLFLFVDKICSNNNMKIPSMYIALPSMRAFGSGPNFVLALAD